MSEISSINSAYTNIHIYIYHAYVAYTTVYTCIHMYMNLLYVQYRSTMYIYIYIPIYDFAHFGIHISCTRLLVSTPAAHNVRAGMDEMEFTEAVRTLPSTYSLATAKPSCGQKKDIFGKHLAARFMPSGVNH